MLGTLVLILLIISATPIVLDTVMGNEIMPDSRLYLVEKFGEMERLGIISLILGDSGKARELLRLAEERVEEAGYCLQNGMPDKAQECMTEWAKLVNMTLIIALKRNSTYLASLVYNATNKHIERLEELSGLVPAGGLNRAVQVATKGRDVAYAVLVRIKKSA